MEAHLNHSLNISYNFYRLSESQKKFFTTVNGCHFVSTVKCLIEWIEDGTYDFFDLPMALKKTISKEFISSIHKAFQG